MVERMKINQYGQVTYNSQEIFEQLYENADLSIASILGDVTDIDFQKHNEAIDKELLELDKIQYPSQIDLSVEQFDTQNQHNWYMPDDFKNIDVEQFIHALCETEQEHKRVTKELELYKERDMYNILRFMIYLVHFMTQNNIVWGVGRGSSVASYCLYLIGVHKVNSIKYNLFIEEFLR